MEYSTMNAEMWNANGWSTLRPFNEIVSDINRDLDRAGFKILKFVDHEFEPHGYTAMWLLAESHFAIHTFPEENTYYWELSSCVKEYYDQYMQLQSQNSGT